MSASARLRSRVLVIEEDAGVRDLLQSALEIEGYRVLTADHTVDPEDVAQLRPDLVILDLWLDGRDSGWRILQELKITPGVRSIPMLICTADAELVEREAEQLALLAAGIVLKPFDLDEFLARVVACQMTSPLRPSTYGWVGSCTDRDHP
jgi:DNA-binding response OmpR family regulator